MVHSWYCGSQHACDRQHHENIPDPLPFATNRRASVRIDPSKSRSRSLLLYHSLPFKGVVRCGLTGDQRWTDSHLAAAPRGTAAPTRFGASSVVAYRHRSPPSPSRSLVSSHRPSRSLCLSHPLSLALSFLFPLPFPSSLSSSACTPASRRVRLDPTPLHHSALSPLPPRIVLPRSPTLSVSCSPLRLFTFPLSLSLSSSPSTSFSLSPQLALVLVTYTFSPYDCLDSPFTLRPHRRFIPRSPSRSTLGGPHPRIVGWRGTPCGTTCLPSSLSLSLTLCSEPSRTTPRSPASLFLPLL